MPNNTPLEPVQLNLDGDQLIERHFGGSIGHTGENDILESWVGIHKDCGHAMHRHHSNDKFDCIACKGCYLRILFHKEIRTYAELRQYLTIELNNLRAHRPSPWRV